MDDAALASLLQSVASGALAPEEAARRLKRLDVEDLGFARIDHHRTLRRGFPEVIYGSGKTPQQVALIAERMAAGGQTVLATRCDAATFDAVKEGDADAG